MTTLWPWMTLALLGAFHGLNPGMGWLFAVALGLQERSRAAVLRSMLPIALGHGLSITAVVALVALTQPFVTAETLRVVGASVLIGFGLYKLIARSHPRWVTMRVSKRDLVVWSFLMATAHGAGLMLVPLLLHMPMSAMAHAAHIAPVAHSACCHHEHAMALAGLPLAEVAVVVVHSGAMLLVMAAVAVIVFEKLGLAVLRRAWLNLDLIWIGALILAGVVSLLLPA